MLKNIGKLFLLVLLLFSMISVPTNSVEAGYCEDDYGNPIPPELCPG